MINKKKIGLVFLILIALGLIGYTVVDSDDNFTGMNVFDDNADEKISQEVKNQIEESGSEKITILVKQDDIKKVSENVKEIGGEIKNGALDYVEIEVPADKVKEVAEDKNVVGIYPDRLYYATLDKSTGFIKSDKFWNNSYTG